MQDKTKELLYAIVGIAGVLYGMYGGYVATGEQLAANTAGYFAFGGLLFGVAKGYQQARADQLGPTDEIVTRLQEMVADGSK